MWTKILHNGINKSNFSLHQLVIKRKEKQNKRNVKHDDVRTNVIQFRTINYYDIQSCIACLASARAKVTSAQCFATTFSISLTPPNSDACRGRSLNEILTDGTSVMLTVPFVHVLNQFLAYHEFSIPSLVPILYKSLVKSASIITPKKFLESHLPRSTSGTRTFTVSLTFPCGNFSLASLVILKACICRLHFTIFLFSVILFSR